MDVSLTKADLDVRERARSLAAKHLFPAEMEVEEANALPPALGKRLKQAVLDHRLNAINHEKDVGGQGMSFVQQSIVNEEVGASTGALWALAWQPPLCLRHASAAQREAFLIPACKGTIDTAYAISEPGAGSDAGGVKTTAQRRNDGWVLNGEKCFASGAEHSELVLVHAHVDGDPAKATIFLVDPRWPGFTIKRMPKFGHNAVHAHPEVEIRDLKVPHENVLGEVGQGFELTKDWFVEARLAIGARCVGMAVRATGLANRYAAERVQFGRAIRDFQGIEFMLAEMAADIMAGKSLLYRVAAAMDRGLERKTAHAQVAAVKLHCSEMAWRVVDKAVQIFGGKGYMRENPVERLYRDVRVERIWEGTSEIQKVVMAGQIKKRGMELYTGWT